MKKIEGRKIFGIAWEFGPPVHRLGIERDLAGRPALMFARARATQFDNWFHILLVAVKLGRPWVTWYHGLVYDDKT